MKLFSSAMTPWISWALIMPVSTSRMTSGGLPAATRVRESQSAAARMPPRLSDGWPHSGREPRVVEIEPADDRADVEGRRDRVELIRRSRHFRAVRHDRAGHDRTEELRAGGKGERFEPAAQRVHQAQPRGVVGFGALDLVVGDVVGDVDQDLVRRGPDVVDGAQFANAHRSERTSAPPGRCRPRWAG